MKILLAGVTVSALFTGYMFHIGSEFGAGFGVATTLGWLGVWISDFIARKAA